MDELHIDACHFNIYNMWFCVHQQPLQQQKLSKIFQKECQQFWELLLLSSIVQRKEMKGEYTASGIWQWSGEQADFLSSHSVCVANYESSKGIWAAEANHSNRFVWSQKMTKRNSTPWKRKINSITQSFIFLLNAWVHYTSMHTHTATLVWFLNKQQQQQHQHHNEFALWENWMKSPPT